MGKSYSCVKVHWNIVAGLGKKICPVKNFSCTVYVPTCIHVPVIVAFTIAMVTIVTNSGILNKGEGQFIYKVEWTHVHNNTVDTHF